MSWRMKKNLLLVLTKLYYQTAVPFYNTTTYHTQIYTRTMWMIVKVDELSWTFFSTCMTTISRRDVRNKKGEKKSREFSREKPKTIIIEDKKGAV